MQIYAPWSLDFVALLNRHQQSKRLHPYTCGNRGDASHPENAVLIATVTGWQCDYCHYVQKWAHDPKFLLDQVKVMEDIVAAMIDSKVKRHEGCSDVSGS